MKKIIPLIKANMTEGMNIFKISTKKKNKFTTIFLPVLLTLLLMLVMASYSEPLMKELVKVKMEFVLLTLFVIITSVMTLIEGIYKSGNLLFNCKDDNLLLSLPISKSTVLYIRIFKFYLFELLYNSIFLIPSMIVYAMYTNPSNTYYLASAVGLILFPIIPVLISCIVGSLITYAASKFKGKNIMQTIITVLFLLVIMYYSYNLNNVMINIAKHASSINDLLTKIYYPVGAYIELITNFNYSKLFEFIFVNILIFTILVLVLGKIYFNINSNIKSVKIGKTNINYKIKSLTKTKTMIKKEFNRFINSPVFVANAGFGVVLFIIGCVFAVIKFDSITESLIKIYPKITMEKITNYIPVLLFGFICFTSFMTSITSSMISLEGKSLNILKSLPLKPYEIIKSKILTALLIMIPCILIGDIIIYIKFKFNIISIALTLIASILLPLISETIGIIINLKYPNMDAKNDTEVVKQSMSSTVSVIIGMTLIGITVSILIKTFNIGLSNNTIISLLILAYTIIYLGLLFFLHKYSDKYFENIKL